MKKSTKTFLIATATLAAAAATISAGAVVVGRLLADVAVKRKIVRFPESMQDKLTGGLISDPNIKTVIEASEDVDQLVTETVNIKSHDGLVLTGRFYHSEGTPKRVIVAMHGWRSSWQIDYGCIAKFYHDEGCTVLYTDQRGQNESEGDYIGFGVLERHDCFEWVKYAVERFGSEIPIYLCGVSMGATTVLMTAGFELPSEIKGIIADCGFTSPRDIWEHVLKNNLKINSMITYPIANAICKRDAKFDGQEYSTIDALSDNEVPVLFIHGSSDGFVPLEMTFRNYLACSAPKELLIVPGAGHGMSYVTDEKAYEKTIKAFFDKCERLGFES